MVKKMLRKRTDLAMEAHELWSAGHEEAHTGVSSKQHDVLGYQVTAVQIKNRSAAEALGKPIGAYSTLDLRPYWDHSPDALKRAAQAVAQELRALIGSAITSALVVGLGNSAMTPDAIGPQAMEHILVTRHLSENKAFASLCMVSVLIPGVSGRTGMEAAETIRGAVRTVKPDVVLAVDALASRSLNRVCTTIQLSNTGIIPGSGVGNHRKALNRSTLGVPVIAIGVPTVVDAATLTLDILEETGAENPNPSALREYGANILVTPRDIDAQIRELSRITGYGINLALQPIAYEELCALMG